MKNLKALFRQQFFISIVGSKVVDFINNHVLKILSSTLLIWWFFIRYSFHFKIKEIFKVIFYHEFYILNIYSSSFEKNRNMAYYDK